MNNFIIGIAGGTGSGKTTLTKKLIEEFKDEICVVYMDDYYKCPEEFGETAKINYDTPSAFDMDMLLGDIVNLKNNLSVEAPVCDPVTHARIWSTRHIDAKKVIIVEGMLAYAVPELRNIIDVKVFVDADSDERIARRIQQETELGGKNVEEVINKYLTEIKPMHLKYLEPTKKYADIMVNGGLNEVAFDLLKTKIINILK